MEIKKKFEVSALEEIKHILVVGLGKSGLSCIDYLTKQIKFKKKLLKLVLNTKIALKQLQGRLKLGASHSLTNAQTLWPALNSNLDKALIIIAPNYRHHDLA